MRVTLMLADAAQAVNDKLYILGGGWSQLWGPMSFAVAIRVEVPWDVATETHTFEIELVDADGHAVTVPSEEGQQQPVMVAGELNTGIPAGTRPGTPMVTVAAITFGALDLPIGRYAIKVSIDGESREDWQLGFNRVAPPRA